MRERLRRAALALAMVAAVAVASLGSVLLIESPLLVASAAALMLDDEAPIATVIEVEGAVSVIRDQGTPEERVMSPVKRGLWLFRGDQIWTGEDGWLELQFEDTARVLVVPNSRVEVVSGLVREVDEETQRVLPTLRLLLGRVYAHVAGALSRLRSFSIETPTAIAGVRGTIFAVDVGLTGRTLVSVQEGVVAVASPDLVRNESLVGAGEEIEVLPGQALPVARLLGQAEAQRWERVRDWLERQHEWRRARAQGEPGGVTTSLIRWFRRVLRGEAALAGLGLQDLRELLWLPIRLPKLTSGDPGAAWHERPRSEWV